MSDIRVTSYSTTFQELCLMPYSGKLRGREQEATNLKRQGLKDYQIAAAMGVAPNAIRALFKRLAQQSATQPAQER